MMITKAALARRTFLRGVGTTLALPLLDAMIPALSATVKTAANPARRLGFFYVPNGVAPSYWHPKGEGTTFEWSPTLAPLAPFRDRVVVVSGLANQKAISTEIGSGPHTRSHAVWLSGVTPKWTEGADILGGTTIDQFAAKHLGVDTQMASLEMALEPSYLGNCDNGYSCVYVNSTSWRTPTMPLPMENNPRLVFERLFGEGGSTESQRARLRQDRSILDAVTNQMTRLQGRLGSSDRGILGDYVEAVRDVERRIQAAEKLVNAEPLPIAQPAGIPEKFEDHAKLMFDLQFLAYHADITRVVTFQIAREQSARAYPEIGCADGHHDISHKTSAEELGRQAKINLHHIRLFTHLVEKMSNTPDGDGSLLDHSILLYGGGMGDGSKHSAQDLPVVLVGGGAGRLKGGRHMQYPQHTPMMNLGLTLLEKVGVEMERIGDSSGRLVDL